MEKKNIYIFALAASGLGISGGDRIFIETSRVLSENNKIKIFVWSEGFAMCKRHDLKKPNIEYHVSEMWPFKNFGFAINYFARIIEGIRLGLTTEVENNKDTVVYSASEFWMDCLPGFILKMRFKDIKWVTAWFQTAPNPLKGFTEGGRRDRYRLSALPYWLAQLFMKPLIKKAAGLILVNNQTEINQFNNLKNNQKVMVFFGALDLDKIEYFKNEYRDIKKKYDAVFQGRFHPQKGVLELVDIWKNIVNVKSNACLVMIGDGPLKRDVELKIKSLDLQKNIILTGYLFDGEDKYKIFAQSRVVVHPAFYDSGGMASAEAMAFGLPCVGFNLEAYKSYYPKGMVKVEVGNLEEFSNQILNLLSDKKYYGDIAVQATNMIQNNWSFKTRTKQLLKEIN